MKICLFTNFPTTELETLIYKIITVIKKRETKKKADNKSESAQSFFNTLFNQIGTTLHDKYQHRLCQHLEQLYRKYI